ncbi:helix-turn-helix transcriptional regulator [Pseudalkalibacillus decolorationis]|uniref:helix-turn-helix transcriptional regulator n=1 Tax=Pseudalkalibacillus decolorationis TaxID=163879 RepID=UPI002147316F|nr:YafY family protein [Pseudalkalibacillus decolorationis]
MKLERMMAITMVLLNRKRVQAQELADRMEVSLRTIYRDLESLNLAGIPIVSYTGTEGGYEIMDNFRLDKQLLSFNELRTLFTAVRGLQSTQVLNDSEMSRLLDKVGALVSQAETGPNDNNDQILIDFTPWKNSDAEKNKYESLHKAIQNNNMITFTYTDNKGNETKRYIEPIGLVLKRYSWYLHGFCTERQDYRIFKLSRVRELQVLEERFNQRNENLSDLNERWQPNTLQKFVDVVLQLSGKAKVSILDYFDENDIERYADGSLIVRGSIPDEDWMIGVLLSFKTDVLILEPPHLAATVRKAALQIADLYLESGELVVSK